MVEMTLWQYERLAQGAGDEDIRPFTAAKRPLFGEDVPAAAHERPQSEPTRGRPSPEGPYWCSPAQASGKTRVIAKIAHLIEQGGVAASHHRGSDSPTKAARSEMEAARWIAARRNAGRVWRLQRGSASALRTQHHRKVANPQGRQPLRRGLQHLRQTGRQRSCCGQTAKRTEADKDTLQRARWQISALEKRPDRPGCRPGLPRRTTLEFLRHTVLAPTSAGRVYNAVDFDDLITTAGQPAQ